MADVRAGVIHNSAMMREECDIKLRRIYCAHFVQWAALPVLRMFDRVLQRHSNLLGYDRHEKCAPIRLGGKH